MRLGYAFLFFGLYFLPFFILGENAYVQIHDNLENEFVYITNILRSGHWLDYNSNYVLNNIMEGIPRNAFRSGINFTFCLFAILPPYWAYVINKLFVHLIGGIGTYLLVKQHYLKNKNQESVVVLMSLAFSIIPYSSIFCGIAVSGQPLLLYAFMNVLKQNYRWPNIFIILAFPFFISPLLIALFIFSSYVILYFLYYFRTRNINYPFWILLVVFGTICLLIELPLINFTLFNPEFESHRKEINRINTYYLLEGDYKASFKLSFLNLLRLIFHGKWQSGNFLNIPIWLVAFYTLCKEANSRFKIFTCAFCIILVCFYTSFFNLLYLIIPSNISTFLNLYSAERLYFLQTMLMFLLLAISVSYLDILRNKKIIFGCIWLQLLFILSANLYFKTNLELKNNLLILFGYPEETKEPSFKQYFDIPLYNKIKDHIGLETKNYRIVNVDLSPSAAQLNGFYTLDSYQNNYDIKYKHKFRSIIKKELNKNEMLKNYFDYNGSRCYFFSSETEGKLIDKKSKQKITNAEWNIDILSTMNGQYIFSAVPILNFKELGLNFENLFQTKDSFYKIYLYKVLIK